MKSVSEKEIYGVLEKLNLDATIDLKNISADESLNSLGLDSLDFMNLYFELEEKYGIKIPNELIEKKYFDSIAGIIKELNGILAKTDG